MFTPALFQTALKLNVNVVRDVKWFLLLDSHIATSHVKLTMADVVVHVEKHSQSVMQLMNHARTFSAAFPLALFMVWQN